jgi:glycerol uptake operon antiterminator
MRDESKEPQRRKRRMGDFEFRFFYLFRSFGIPYAEAVCVFAAERQRTHVRGDWRALPLQNQMLERLLDFPVIAAVKNEDGLKRALTSPSPAVFVLFGDVCSIGGIVRQIKASGKLAIVHLDLLDGLAPREISVRFLKSNTEADGIISTRAQLVRCAKEIGLIAVQRHFLLDSMSLENAQKHIRAGTADFNEILPGVMPKIIRRCVQEAEAPVIAGGMILDKDDIVSALGAGATAVSTTRENLWFE